MPNCLPLILLPGMGADARLFRAQAAAFANLVTPNWITPQPEETLPSYAKRMAAAVDPGGPCLVGGVSFGGMVALEMARHLDARACLLIASIRSPDELPWRLRMLRRPVRLVPNTCGSVATCCARMALALGLRRWKGPLREELEQLADTEGRFLLWSGKAILNWQPTLPPLGIPVIHLHGTQDHILPARLTHPDVLVPGAGHVLPLTHPEAVNEFLRCRMAEYGKAGGPVCGNVPRQPRR